MGNPVVLRVTVLFLSAPLAIVSTVPLLPPSSLAKRDERFALIGLTYSPVLLARQCLREKENEVREGRTHKGRDWSI